jgi:hypothetical protein
VKRPGIDEAVLSPQKVHPSKVILLWNVKERRQLPIGAGVAGTAAESIGADSSLNEASE